MSVPGSGITPALRPNWPGTHWPFCWADESTVDTRTKLARTKMRLLSFHCFFFLLPEARTASRPQK
jgi:hypothetical protein